MGQWQITHDLFTMVYQGDIMYADLAAEKQFQAQNVEQFIVVEVKNFLRKSQLTLPSEFGRSRLR